MKRVIAILLSCCLLLGLSGCSRNKGASPDGLTAGTYDYSHAKFNELRQYYFDYFLELYGIKHLESDKNGNYSDEDVITFAFVYLSRGLGEDISEGVTKKRLNEVAEKYLAHTITDFDTDCSMVNPANDKVIFTQYSIDFFGDVMVLQKLIVKKDGTHEAEFHRCTLPDEFWVEQPVPNAFEKLVTGDYKPFGTDITVTPLRVVFKVLVDKKNNNKQYLQISTMKPAALDG
ncbi:MAG: hypothetical protein J6Q42_05865 [Clostridia bacterium]|nr:hypothetical protein [Clostridia bacterium]